MAEVALAIQFESITDLLAVHLGSIRSCFLPEFPKVAEHPPLPPIAIGSTNLAIAFQVLDSPELPRTWFLSEDDSRLVQFQADRLSVNWRRTTDEPYPHYEQIRELLVDAWTRLLEALEAIGLDEIRPTACEASYLNPIVSGDSGMWSGFGELGEVLAQWSGETSDAFLPEPEEVRLAARYAMPDGVGFLHVDANPARRRADGSSTLMLQLRAFGPPVGEGLDGALQFLDLGHEWIVRGFASATTATMHDLWGRER